MSFHALVNTTLITGILASASIAHGAERAASSAPARLNSGAVEMRIKPGL